MAVILSIGSVAGCGKKEEVKKSNTSGGSGAATNAETEYFSNVPEELDGTTVKFATWIDHNSNESSQVLADFTNLTGIKVEITYVPQMDYANKIAGLISSGQSPDVYVSNGDFPVCMQMLQPLDKTILNPSDSFWDQDIVKMGTIGGHSYLVNVKGGAWDMGGSCVVYNKRFFEDNGISTPDLYLQEGRWTLDNFYKCAKELSQVDESSGVGIDINSYVDTYSVGLVTYDNEKNEFVNNCTKPDVVSAWQRMIEARDSKIAILKDDGYRNHFEEGKLGMLFVGTYGLRKTGWFSEMDADDISYIIPPKADASSEQKYGVASTRSYGIIKGAKNADGAAYFLRYFLNGNNYDPAELYKSEELGEMYKEILNNASTNYNFNTSVMNIVAASDTLMPTFTIFPDLKTCTASQVSTALSSSSNKLDTCIEKANEILQKVIEENK